MSVTAKQKRLYAGLAIAAAIIAVGAIAFSNMGNNLVYYWSPSELIARSQDATGPTIRLGGVVKAGTIKWDADKNTLAFDCQETHVIGSPSVHVVSEGIPPQMFRDGIGVVVEGTWDGQGTFHSSRLMVNHSNEYQPPNHPRSDDVPKTQANLGAP